MVFLNKKIGGGGGEGEENENLGGHTFNPPSYNNNNNMNECNSKRDDV